VFINCDHRLFSTGEVSCADDVGTGSAASAGNGSVTGAGAGSAAGAATGSANVHALKDPRQSLQNSPAALGDPQTRQLRTASGRAFMDGDGSAGVTADASSRPQHTQY
jgi:hypothetical protein